MDIFINNIIPTLALLLPSMLLLVAASFIKRKGEFRLKLFLLCAFYAISAALCTALSFCLISFGGGLPHIFPVLLIHLLLALI